MRMYSVHIKFGRLVALLFLLVILSIAFGVVPTAMAQNVDGMGVKRTTDNIMNQQRSLLNSIATRPVRIKAEAENDERKEAPQNPLSPAVSATSENNPNAEIPRTKGTVAGPYAPQTASLEFTGATLADTGFFPPDTMGAVGPT